MDEAGIMADVDRAFGHLSRPETMVRDPNHCDECAEHEATMQSVTPQTVSLKEVGSSGWDPIHYLTDEAFCYFMPGLARLSLVRSYLFQFLFYLNEGSRINAFNSEQRIAVLNLMDFIRITRLHEITEDWIEQDFNRVKNLLRDSS